MRHRSTRPPRCRGHRAAALPRPRRVPPPPRVRGRRARRRLSVPAPHAARRAPTPGQPRSSFGYLSYLLPPRVVPCGMHCPDTLVGREVHGSRPVAAHPGGGRPHHTGPRCRRQGTSSDRRRKRKGRNVPRRGIRTARRGRAAEPAAAREVGRRRAAVRGVPASTGGGRRALGGGGGGGQRAFVVLSSAARVRVRRTAPALAAGDAVR